MNIEIKKVDYRDAGQMAQLISLLNDYACDAMGGGTPLKAEVAAALPEKLAAFPGAFSFILYADNKPAGFTNCFTGFSTFKAKPLVNIHDLAVGNSYRGKGFSYKLLQAIEDEAKSRGCCKVTLEVLAGNDVAKKSYLSFGFSGYELNSETGQALFWEKVL